MNAKPAGVLALVSAALMAAGTASAQSPSLPPSAAGVEIVGQLAPKGPFAGLDADQAGAIAVHRGHAYVASGSAGGCTRGGAFVVDLTDPAKPREAAFVAAPAGSVYAGGIHAAPLATPGFTGDVLALLRVSCGGGAGFDLYDVTDPSVPKPLGGRAGDEPSGDVASLAGLHLWQDGAKAYLALADPGGATDLEIFDVTDAKAPVQVADVDLDATFPSIVGSGAHGSEFRAREMVVREIAGVQTLLIAYGDAGFVQLDVDDPAQPELLADTTYPATDPFVAVSPPEGNAQDGDFSHDARFVIGAGLDERPFRSEFAIVSGPHAGPAPGGELAWTTPVHTLPSGRLNGPTVFGGYGCDADDDIPARASAGLRPLAAGEEAIVVLERGPIDDPQHAYPGCRLDEKAQNAIDKGYTGVLIAQYHGGSQAADAPHCGDGEARAIAAACITHAAMHRIFGETPSYERPYARPNPNEPMPGQLGEDVAVVPTFDGWGHVTVHDRLTGATTDAWAIPEAIDERFAAGFGSLSVRDVASDPSTGLVYVAHGAGGFRVLALDGAGKVKETGRLTGPPAGDVTGVEPFAAADGSRLIAASDRDRGLLVLRYSGPGAVGPTPKPPAPDPAPPATAPPGPVATPTPVPQPAGPRVAPRGVSLKVARRARRGRTTLTSTGKVALPAGVSRSACNGRVRVLVKAGRATVSSRTVALKSDCTFRSRVTLARRRGAALRVQATFNGNEKLMSKRSRVRRVRR